MHRTARETFLEKLVQICAASPKKAEGRKICWAIVGQTSLAKHAEKEEAANPYGCGFFVNYPAWIRTRTKRAKISCATVTLRGKNAGFSSKLVIQNLFVTSGF